MTQDNLFDNTNTSQEKQAPSERVYDEKQAKKWSFGISSRKVEKELGNGLNDLKWLMRTSINVYGVVGGKESRCRSNILVGPVCNHAALKEYIELGEKYEWMVLPSNADALRIDLAAALKKAEAGLPINDHRETQDAAEQREAEEKTRHEA